MKKWHMESIVNYTGTDQKLVIPTPGDLYLGGKLKLAEKEFFLLPMLRKLVANLLKRL